MIPYSCSFNEKQQFTKKCESGYLCAHHHIEDENNSSPEIAHEVFTANFYERITRQLIFEAGNIVYLFRSLNTPNTFNDEDLFRRLQPKITGLYIPSRIVSIIVKVQGNDIDIIASLDR